MCPASGSRFHGDARCNACHAEGWIDPGRSQRSCRYSIYLRTPWRDRESVYQKCCGSCCCLAPWRRTPYWLMVRVALQTSLKEWEVEPRCGYKVFITFVLARILERALNANMSHHVLFVMNAKIAIRVSKFSAAALSSPAFEYIASQTKACSVLLEKGWKDIQAAEAVPLNWITPTAEEINIAKGFLLTNSKAYLSEVYNRRKTLSQASNSFSPSSFEATLPNHTSITGQSPPSAIPLNASGVDLWIGILDVERWVACDMNKWLTIPSSRNNVEAVVETLRQMIARHDSLAVTFSGSNPALFSRVFLTQMELWVALDKTVVNNIPLLAEYSPELDVTLFEPLLLPTLDQMIRLRAVENYLQDRRNDVKCPNHSIFEFANHWNSFAARYFDKDLALQSLRSEIQEKARRERASKRDEWRTLNDKYNNLTMSASRLDHTYVECQNRWGDPISTHYSYFCKKCQLENEANNLSIDVHEWPLPEDDVLSRLVVFELHLPNTFGVWRDTTFSIARRYTSKTAKTNPPPALVLCDYPALSTYFKSNITHQQLTIASTTKSFLVSHYRRKDFPCKEDDVVKNHGLRYDMLDESARAWVAPSIFPSMNIRKQCTLSLAPGPYVQLGWSIVGTKHTPNMVIARQSQCPVVLSYHEWDAFGHLRAGNHLQWRNMMLELIRGTLTLGNSAVYLLFCQAAWQAEKALSSEDNEKDLEPHREAHFDLSEAEFGQEVLTVLRERFNKISGNWKEGWTAATLSMIACRLFLLNADEKLKDGVRDFLASLRKTISGWMKQVLRLMKSGATELTTEEINELRDRVIQLAITCRSTYMLGDAIADIFCNSNALTLFIDSAMVLQNIVPPNLSSLSIPLRYVAEKDLVLSAEVFNMLRAAIDSDNFGLDNAIRCNTWQAFRRDTCVPWKPIGDRWMTCQTSSEGNAQVCHVYFNLHIGTFLVNGKTIGGLPKDILGHSLFQSLFSNQPTSSLPL
ncbi:hypothetical protein PILCRDRAFT_649806 [Piloderma croceum F 1598]|uniref:DUF6606 domain-containing protein n=1 Tax=Piloderma croceum (strain F 1598) TaxID=765440 RepID=A0A0C3AR72_PILCF|nr:hypothetical protein PILCRDRAFT_649806 [Piloderma croceum F 1598]